MAAKGKRRFPVLAALALGLFAALLLAPQTGWVVREQLRMQVPPPSPLAALLLAARTRDTTWFAVAAAAERQPDDFDLQFFLAVDPPTGPLPDLPRLLALAERFPPTPALLAALLNAAGDEGIHLPSEPALPHREPHPPPEPDLLATYERYALAGERLDPDNAYFPFMRTLGLFGAGRDEEAFAALHHAAEKPRWDDYEADVLALTDQVRRRVRGRVSAVERERALLAAPWLTRAPLRRIARHVTAHAAELERAGRHEEALALRLALARVGARFRADSRLADGAHYGGALLYHSAADLGGTPEPDTSFGDRGFERREAYLEHLRALGREEEADWFRAEADAADQVTAVLRARYELVDVWLVRSLALRLWWSAGAVLLANLLGLLLLALVAALVLRLPHVPGWAAALILAAAVGSFAALGVEAVSAPFWLASWLAQQLEERVPSEALRWFYGASAFLDYPNNWLALGLRVVLPLAVLAGVWLMSVFRADGGFYRRLRRAAPAVACLLVFGYAAVVSFTLREEAAVHAQLDRVLEHQGRYLADLAGLEWPE